MTDVKTNEIVSYQLSKSLDAEFVINTITEGIEKVPKNKKEKLIIHSDRVIHYIYKKTHKK